MSKVLDELLALLALEKIEEGLFRGQSQDLGLRSVFGGQVMGQALSAAKQTVASDRQVHSFHSYFLRPGDANKPIVYDVGEHPRRPDRLHPPGQGHPEWQAHLLPQRLLPGGGRGLRAPGEDAGRHHAPEQLKSELELVRPYEQMIPAALRDKILCEKPIEIRPVTLVDPIRPDVHEPLRYTWFKANGPVPDDQRVHNYLLAYASDFHFLFAALQPHGVSYWEPDMQVATIDHSMWFHREFRLDDWLLYVVDSPSASGGRGLVRGQFFTRMGYCGEHHAGRGDPSPGLRRPLCANENGSRWLPFLLPALSGCVLLGAECWLAPGETVGPQGDDAVTGDVAGGAEAVLGQVEGDHQGDGGLTEAEHGSEQAERGHDTATRCARRGNHDDAQHHDEGHHGAVARNGQVFGEEHHRRGAGYQGDGGAAQVDGGAQGHGEVGDAVAHAVALAGLQGHRNGGGAGHGAKGGEVGGQHVLDEHDGERPWARPVPTNRTQSQIQCMTMAITSTTRRS